MSTNTDFAPFLGQQAEPDRVSRFPINAPMIRQWLEAIDDNNPVYSDVAVAHETGRTDIICPPAMLSTWVMQGYRRHRDLRAQRAAGVTEDTAYSRLLQELDAAGYTSVVATNLTQQYFKELTLGLNVRCEITIESISDTKRTGLGEGRFMTLFKRYLDQDNEVLAEERFRLLRFKPVAATAAPRPTGVPPIIRTHDNIFWFDGAAEGRLLIQRCSACETLRHPPTPSCASCQSLEWDTVESAAQGTLHSWTVVHHPQDSAFGYPLAVGLVDLPEGIRFVADFETLPDSLEIDMPVHLEFTEHAYGEMLPSIRPGVRPETPAPVATTADPSAEVEVPLPEGAVRIPALEVALDRTAIAAGALASQDYEDVHHDPVLAQERGMRDVFISINSTNGYLNRFITDWAGPGARIQSLDLKLGVPHFAGETLRFTGHGTPSGSVWNLELVGRNDDGVHVSATAVVDIPTTVLKGM